MCPFNLYFESRTILHVLKYLSLLVSVRKLRILGRKGIFIEISEKGMLGVHYDHKNDQCSIEY